MTEALISQTEIKKMFDKYWHRAKKKAELKIMKILSTVSHREGGLAWEKLFTK